MICCGREQYDKWATISNTAASHSDTQTPITSLHLHLKETTMTTAKPTTMTTRTRSYLHRCEAQVEGIHMVLCEQGDAHLSIGSDESLVCLQRAHQQLDHGRLAATVRSKHANTGLLHDLAADLVQQPGTRLGDHLDLFFLVLAVITVQTRLLVLQSLQRLGLSSSGVAVCAYSTKHKARIHVKNSPVDSNPRLRRTQYEERTGSTRR